jgi:hypothetical protein
MIKTVDFQKYFVLRMTEMIIKTLWTVTVSGQIMLYLLS